MDHLILAFALVIAGLLFMASELVLFTHGVLAMIGLGGVIIGSILLLGRDPFLGILTLLILVVIVPFGGRLAITIWPNTPIGRKFILHPPSPQSTIAETPQSLELERLRGRYGKTLSSLRPAGAVDFDGQRVDAMSEGIMIDAGQWVRCIDIRGGAAIVRLTEGPPSAANLEEMTL